MRQLLKSFFGIEPKPLEKSNLIVRKENEWFEFELEKPPRKVVLAACDTYDCGWVMDTVWWDDKNKCWMTTGTVESMQAHLPYSRWRHLPPDPEGH
jgi:hypothetical protein